VTDFDLRHSAQFRYGDSFGFSPWSASASHSVAYVTSTLRQDDSEINVASDLTGEVELHFKTDHIPLDRFATNPTIARVQGNTANPDANTPVGVNPPAPFSEPPQVGGEVVKSKVPERKPPKEPQLAPPPKNPLAEPPKAPTKVTPVEKDDQMTDQQRIKVEEERRRRQEKGELVPQADPSLKLDEKPKESEPAKPEKKKEEKSKEHAKADVKKEEPAKKEAVKPEAKKPETTNETGGADSSHDNADTAGDGNGDGGGADDGGGGE
jgi:hypothetical protein